MTELGETSASTPQDWQAAALSSTSAGNAAAENQTSRPVNNNLMNWLFSMPPWLVNGSFVDHSMLEKMMEKHKHEMVPPPGKQNSPGLTDY